MSDESYRMAVTSAQAWFMIEDLTFKREPRQAHGDILLRKWRKLLAIMEVAMRMPIYYSRHAPEAIMLAWFFGLPGYGREQDMERFKRIPLGQDKRYRELWTQVKLFEKPWKTSDKGILKGYDYEGDDEFKASCAEIHANVLATLKRV